jgi:choline kinase
MAEGRTSEYFEAALNHAIAAGLEVRAVPTAGRAWTEIDFEEDLQLARSILPRLRGAG